jgi:hypothetical protein
MNQAPDPVRQADIPGRNEPDGAAVCCRCGRALERDIIYADLRYYVCRPCGTWAVPYPPTFLS